LKRKLLFAFAAITLLSSFALVVTVGWALAAPVQVNIGPAPGDLDAEAVQFKSESAALVHGWWCPVDNGHGTVLLLPGIRANRLSMVDRARFLRHAGYSVLLIDLQGTGETKGDHITFGWKESRDVIAAVSFIRERDPRARIAIIGSSLGGAAALLAIPPLKVNALVLEEVYPTIEIATRNRLDHYLGTLGRYVAPLLLGQLHARVGISSRDLRPVDHIKQISCPVLLIDGEKDRNTRLSDTQMLFDQAPSPKQLWIVPSAEHVDLHHASPVEYEKRVLTFLQ
jgi:alpha-beta hydrolase superfamily lysophospholipase